MKAVRNCTYFWHIASMTLLFFHNLSSGRSGIVVPNLWSWRIRFQMWTSKNLRRKKKQNKTKTKQNRTKKQNLKTFLVIYFLNWYHWGRKVTHDFQCMELVLHYSANFKSTLSHMVLHMSASGSTVILDAVLDSVWTLVETQLECNCDLQKKKKVVIQKKNSVSLWSWSTSDPRCQTGCLTKSKIQWSVYTHKGPMVERDGKINSVCL